LTREARGAAKAGRFVEALRLVDRVLKRDPDDQDALMIGVIAACNTHLAERAAGYIPKLRAGGRRSMAVQICEKQLGYDPRSLEASGRSCQLDEVACLLAKNPPACCKQYAKPVRLEERSHIKNGISKVRKQVSACMRDRDDAGTVKVNVSVASTGKVAEVSVLQAPNERIGKCVADAVRRAVFVETKEGGSFVYPFVFR
jgi:TonB family protein